MVLLCNVWIVQASRESDEVGNGKMGRVVMSERGAVSGSGLSPVAQTRVSAVGLHGHQVLAGLAPQPML